ncbi:protein DMP4-like [Rhododendron vialii]|uniref:protein DMP4-like n=1 Tax=Rhododendron vialii TaxID=182163 RepID=UPI00265F3CE3|nr:protein DMP4-like [Rhododendron vialii]
MAEPPPPPPAKRGSNGRLLHKILAATATLANLLPTGTVLAFQALLPSFSNGGDCQITNKYLTASLIVFCADLCFLSSFTDSFTDCNGRLYYGIATFKGLYIFNCDGEEREGAKDLARYKISCVDFVHAFMSLFVFLIFALSDSEVQGCLFPGAGVDENVLVMNLPLGAGVLSSFLFVLFPTTRRGIGYAHLTPGER